MSLELDVIIGKGRHQRRSYKYAEIFEETPNAKV